MAGHILGECSTNECTPLELPRGAKPFGGQLIRCIGASILVEFLEPNAWPEHVHSTHWQLVVVFAPGVCKATYGRPGGKITRRRITAGEVWILPPGWRHSVQWTCRAQVIVLYIEAKSVRDHFPQIEPEEIVGSLGAYVASNPDIAELCAEARRLGNQSTALTRWQLAGTGTKLALLMLDAHIKVIHGGSERLMGLAERVAEKAKTQIATDIRAKPPGENFARSLGVSGRHFRRLFLRATGTSLKEYLAFARTKHAIRLLRGGTHNVNEAADAAGFSDTCYLNRCTQKYYSVAPSAFMPRRAWPPSA